jgi:hypothetical protein
MIYYNRYDWIWYVEKKDDVTIIWHDVHIGVLLDHLWLWYNYIDQKVCEELWIPVWIRIDEFVLNNRRDITKALPLNPTKEREYTVDVIYLLIK